MHQLRHQLMAASYLLCSRHSFPSQSFPRTRSVWGSCAAAAAEQDRLLRFAGTAAAGRHRARACCLRSWTRAAQAT